MMEIGDEVQSRVLPVSLLWCSGIIAIAILSTHSPHTTSNRPVVIVVVVVGRKPEHSGLKKKEEEKIVPGKKSRWRLDLLWPAVFLDVP